MFGFFFSSFQVHKALGTLMCCLNILISVEIYAVSVHLKIGLQENVLLDIYSKNVEGKGGHFIYI